MNCELRTDCVSAIKYGLLLLYSKFSFLILVFLPQALPTFFPLLAGNSLNQPVE